MRLNGGYVRYIAALLLFGSNGIVASFIHLTSTQIVLTRSVIGSVALCALFVLGGGRLSVREDRRALVCIAIAGLSMGATWMFLYEAYTRIGVSLATVMLYCAPVMVVAVSPAIFGERLTAPKAVGLVAALCGAVLVNWTSLGDMDVTGLLCGAAAAVSHAVVIIFNKKAAIKSGMENAMLQMLFCAAAVAAFTIPTGGASFTPASSDIVPILVLGLLNTSFVCYLYFSGMSGLSVQSVSICGYLEPLAAVVFAAVFLGESMSMAQTAGAALILGGAAVAELSRAHLP